MELDESEPCEECGEIECSDYCRCDGCRDALVLTQEQIFEARD